MKNKEVFAFFDLCNTLISYQTADDFIDFVGRKHNKLLTNLNKVFLSMLSSIRVLNGNRYKRLQLYQIRGIDKKAIQQAAQDFIQEKLLINQNKIIIEKLNWHLSQNHTVVIVSGGYTEYIKLYAESLGVSHVIATDIEFKKLKTTGKIEGLDCMGINKIMKLKKKFNFDEIDFSNSFAYSDHESDIPLLSRVGNSFVVSFGQNIEWADAMGYKVIDV
jgi:HAD superfamily hydrolase (TIGR01490 family)